MYRVSCLILGLVVSMSGCGSNQPEGIPVDESAQTVTDSKLKSFLEDVAKSGEAGSGIEEIRTGIEELKQTNADAASKIEAMLSDLEAADQAKKKSDVKRIAKDMASLL